MQSTEPQATNYRPRGDFASREGGKELVVINMETGEYHTMNPVGGCIWEAINDGRPSSEIIQSIVNRFDIDSETATVEMFRFIDNLLQQGLLEAIG